MSAAGKRQVKAPLECAEEGCEADVAGFIDSKAVCETHLAQEFERRMRAGKPVNLGENGNQRREQPFERPATPGATVLYHSDAPGEPLLPAIVVATPESRPEADWFPDFKDPLVRHLEEPVHLAVLNPDPGTPLFFVPRVGRGEGAGEWRWPA